MTETASRLTDEQLEACRRDGYNEELGKEPDREL